MADIIDSDESFTINEFCRAEKISRAYFYKLKKQGRGPRLMATNRITQQARRDWQRAREAEAAAGNSEAA